MFLDIEGTGIELKPFPEDAELPRWHIISPCLSDREGKELGDNRSDDNTWSSKRQQHINTGSKSTKNESNCPHSNSVLDISHLITRT
jgi:hypothetical protein